MKKGKDNFKLLGGILAGMLIGGVTVVGANQAIQAIQNTEIKVSLNGQVQEFKDETTGEVQYPITYHDRTYLPLRNVAQLSGLNVDYEQSSNTALLNTNKENTILYNQESSNNDKLKVVWPGNDYYSIEISKDGKCVSYRCCDGDEGAEVVLTSINDNINVSKLVVTCNEMRDGNREYLFSYTRLAFLTDDGQVFISDSFNDLHFPDDKLNFYYLCSNVKDLDVVDVNGFSNFKVLKNNEYINVEFMESNKDFSYNGIDGKVKKIVVVGNNINEFAYRIFVLTQEGYVYYADHIFSNVEDDVINFTKFEGIEKIRQITDSSSNDNDFFYSGKVLGHVCFEKYIKQVRNNDGVYNHDIYRRYVISNDSYEVVRISDVSSIT